MGTHGLRLVAIVGATALGVLGLKEREAAACGGYVPPPAELVDTKVTEHRMIFSVSTTQTTLYDQIHFSGSPSSFAWILPISGTVTVGLSADILFDSIDALTQTVINPPTTPPCYYGSSGSSGTSSGAGGSSGGYYDSGVTVISQEQVGPYEIVQLKSSDGSALTTWLTANGYSVPSAEAPIIADYVAEGMNFLAMKLVPGAGISAMQPVRITTAGASTVLPLHMVRVGAREKTSITLWIVADGRWEPQNFPVFTIGETDLAWNWNTETSDYDFLQTAKEQEMKGAGWQVESSIDLNQTTVTDLVLSSIATDGDGGGYLTPPDAGVPEGGSLDAGADAGAMTSAAEADLAVLFTGITGPNARFTRLRTNISRAALSKDLQIMSTKNQSELSNQLTPSKQIDDGCGGTPSLASAGNAYNAGASGPSPVRQGDGISGSGGSGGCSVATTSVGYALPMGFIVVSFVGFRSLKKRLSRSQESARQKAS